MPKEVTLLIWAILGYMCFHCLGCGEKRVTSPEASEYNIKVEDDMGRIIKRNSPASRIVSLSPGFTEILFALGCDTKMVARDIWSDYPQDALKLPATDSVNPSVDAIAGYDPDLVLLYFNSGRLVNAFSKIGIDVAVFNPGSYDEVANTVIKIGTLCGSLPKAKEIAKTMKQKRDAVWQKAKQHQMKKRVYVEIDGTDPMRPWTVGTGSFIDELLTFSGAQNVFDGLSKPYAQVNLEEVIAANPDAIVLAGTHAPVINELSFLKKRPGFKSIKAIKTDKIIHTIDKNIISRPTYRLQDALEELYAQLYPGGTL